MLRCVFSRLLKAKSKTTPRWTQHWLPWSSWCFRRHLHLHLGLPCVLAWKIYSDLVSGKVGICVEIGQKKIAHRLYKSRRQSTQGTSGLGSCKTFLKGLISGEQRKGGQFTFIFFFQMANILLAHFGSESLKRGATKPPSKRIINLFVMKLKNIELLPLHATFFVKWELFICLGVWFAGHEKLRVKTFIRI